jgi:hypothetical protein
MNFQARRFHRNALTSGAILLFAALQFGVAMAKTWTVERDGSGDFVVIQDAVFASSPGDTILLGPGRFPEHAPFQLGVTNYDTYVGIDVDDLAIIGRGAELTVVGPTVPEIMGPEPIGFSFGVGVTRLTIQRVKIENVRSGIYAEGGSLVLRDSQLSNCRWGTILLNAVDSRISTSTIDSCETGIAALQASSGLSISEVIVNGPGDIAFTIQQSSSNAELAGIDVAGTTTGISIVSGSSATIRDARMITTGVSLGVTGGSVVELASSTLVSDLNAIFVAGQNSLLLASDSSIRGGSIAAIHMSTLGQATVSACDIVRNGAPAVVADDYRLPPIIEIDLRNNFWGTTEADSIAAWIVDGNDLHDPPLDPNYSNVLFDPFLEQSIPTVKRSLGSLKASFGLREHKEPE